MKRILSVCVLLFVFVCIQAQYAAPVQMDKASDPQKVIGEVLTKTGVISLSTGVPCLAVGIATLMSANFIPNPMDSYTTSSIQAESNKNLQLISADEYYNKLRNFSDLTHALELTGYVLTPVGAALTIVGIPLYVNGQKIMNLDIQYTGNGAGVSINF